MHVKGRCEKMLPMQLFKECVCLAPKGARKRKNLQLDLHALACRVAAQLKARSAPGQDTRSGQGALARRHTDGPLWAALLKTTVMCEAWRRRTIAPPDPSRTSSFFCDFGQS